MSYCFYFVVNQEPLLLGDLLSTIGICLGGAQVGAIILFLLPPALFNKVEKFGIKKILLITGGVVYVIADVILQWLGFNKWFNNAKFYNIKLIK